MSIFETSSGEKACLLTKNGNVISLLKHSATLCLPWALTCYIKK